VWSAVSIWCSWCRQGP